jgi:hypothetical protein
MTNIQNISDQKKFRQRKVGKEDISGHHEMILRASELCHYHANCKRGI